MSAEPALNFWKPHRSSTESQLAAFACLHPDHCESAKTGQPSFSATTPETMLIRVWMKKLFVELESGVSKAGLNVHAASAGSPLHERLIVPVNVPWGATVSMKVPDCPAVIVALFGFELKLKFCEATPWPENPMICGEIAALSFRVTVPSTVEVSVGER